MRKEQIKPTLQEIGIPISFFCRNIGISQTAFYKWIHGELKLSESNEQRITDYMEKAMYFMEELSKLHYLGE